ncbi:MAG: sugar phosphate isomerase/epimerase [Clostridia bacterium]|nr:sugar phosphate isomerase/epimerase [Clostridia bacterium]
MYQLEFTCTTPSSFIPRGLQNGKYKYALDPNYEEKVREMKEAGIKKVEFVIPYIMDIDAAKKMLKRTLKIIKKYKLTINSIHMPFNVFWMDMACQWENDRKDIINTVKNIIKYIDKHFNPKVYVFHPGGDEAKEETREKFMDYLVETIDEIATATKAYVCVENMVGGCLTNGLERIKEFADKSKNAYVIVDVNHFLDCKPQDAILALGDRVKAVHISDYDFVYERHMIPGDGLNDWNKIIGALEKIGYKGAFNYEVNMGRYGYTYKQLIENYEKLFEEYNKSK